MDVGSTVYGGSDHMTALLQNNHRHLSSSSSSEPIDSLWLPSPSPSFRASDSMVNFDDVKGRRISSSPDVQTPTFRPRSREETGGGSGDDEFDPSFHHHPEKKRRLTVEQVQYLERSFEVENKLEPERKVQLAKELGLQPRQVAIWFQNRRARFKTKQLEKDYDLLKASYDTLKADYDILLKEKENLMTEVAFLTNKLKPKEKQMTNSDPHSPIDSNHLEPKELAVNAISENVDKPETAVVVCKQEDASSAKSDVFDSESPHCTEGNHSSLLEPANSSSHMFEPEQQSDFSQDEEDQYLMSRSLLQPLPPPPAYNFPKLEEGCYTAADPHGNSGSLTLPVEDQHFWSWLYQS